MKFRAKVTRIATKTLTLEVEAESKEEADEKLIEKANDTNFGVGDTQGYSVDNIRSS